MLSSDEIWSKVRGRLQQYLSDVGWDTSLLERLLNVQQLAMGGWVIGAKPPMAQQIIQMWHLFDVWGYESPELQQLDAENRYYGLLFAMGVVPLAEMTDALLHVSVQTTLQVMRGSTPTKAEYSIEQLKELYDDELQAKLDALPQIDHQKAEAAPAAVSEAPAETKAETVAATVVVPNSMDAVMLVATLVSAMNPMASALVLGSKEDRDRLRRVVTTDVIFRATNLLGALCSERALAEGLKHGLEQP